MTVSAAMRVLCVLTYYRPHTSGLTIYAERLARAYARRGHRVTVLTSQFERGLPRLELDGPVRVVRVPVLGRLSKGVVMPTFGLEATRQVREHDVLHLHLPQLDAAGVALRGHLLGRPTLLTYHCDLTLPPGPLNRLAGLAVRAANHLAARFSDRVVSYTSDYAAHSPFLARWAAKLEVVPPPVELPLTSDQAVRALAERLNPERRRPVIGMAARLAAEKGVEVLLAALPLLLERHPRAVLLFAGQHAGVLGERATLERLRPAIAELQRQGCWHFAGVLGPEEMAAFYPNLDLLVVPSLNATESFGLVQVEAMACGVPVVASDLPGVRQPVRMTGMGLIAAVGSAESLAEAMLRVLAAPADFRGDPRQVAASFTPDATAAAYERIFERLLTARGRRAT